MQSCWPHDLGGVYGQRHLFDLCSERYIVFPSRRTECGPDYVEIYDGNLDSKLLGRYCSGSFLTFTSTSNVLTVRFHTDSSVTSRGFDAYYSSFYYHLGEYMHT
uniref:CUB domain-containing protein n=1 Tax=Anolis carolinensis TaxID=28377 RepID=A0A803TLH2_ANOCA